ncbi:MAG: hypothetical protein BWY78_01412 [Alphaproteobacteria bacterium ADurb.Bin438]|nr:MAG: hypothetical protein BWY78_01412 [Alphaproteobacteria bacterium ADurb.Bin438]
MFNNIGIAILSWKAPQTLDATLASYQKANLFSHFKEVVVNLVEARDEDIEIAKKYGLKYVTYDKNLGILGGMEAAINSVSTDYVFYLENDLPLIENEEEVVKQFSLGIEALENKTIDVMHLRSRFNPGVGYGMQKYTRYYDIVDMDENFNQQDTISKDPTYLKILRRIFYPTKAKRMISGCLFVEKNPEKLFPKYISRYKDIFVIDSEILPWTNQSFLIKKDFMNSLFQYAKAHPTSRKVNNFLTFERELNSKWWKKQHYKMGFGKGLFTHQRLDR